MTTITSGSSIRSSISSLARRLQKTASSLPDSVFARGSNSAYASSRLAFDPSHASRLAQTAMSYANSFARSSSHSARSRPSSRFRNFLHLLRNRRSTDSLELDSGHRDLLRVGAASQVISELTSRGRFRTLDNLHGYLDSVVDRAATESSDDQSIVRGLRLPQPPPYASISRDSSPPPYTPFLSELATENITQAAPSDTDVSNSVGETVATSSTQNHSRTGDSLADLGYQPTRSRYPWSPDSFYSTWSQSPSIAEMDRDPVNVPTDSSRPTRSRSLLPRFLPSRSQGPTSHSDPHTTSQARSVIANPSSSRDPRAYTQIISSTPQSAPQTTSLSRSVFANPTTRSTHLGSRFFSRNRSSSPPHLIPTNRSDRYSWNYWDSIPRRRPGMSSLPPSRPLTGQRAGVYELDASPASQMSSNLPWTRPSPVINTSLPGSGYSGNARTQSTLSGAVSRTYDASELLERVKTGLRDLSQLSDLISGLQAYQREVRRSSASWPATG